MNYPAKVSVVLQMRAATGFAAAFLYAGFQDALHQRI